MAPRKVPQVFQPTGEGPVGLEFFKIYLKQCHASVSRQVFPPTDSTPETAGGPSRKGAASAGTGASVRGHGSESQTQMISAVSVAFYFPYVLKGAETAQDKCLGAMEPQTMNTGKTSGKSRGGVSLTGHRGSGKGDTVEADSASGASQREQRGIHGLEEACSLPGGSFATSS